MSDKLVNSIESALECVHRVLWEIFGQGEIYYPLFIERTFNKSTSMSHKGVLSNKERELEKVVDEIKSHGTLEGIGILKSYSDQYLKNVLEEVENDFKARIYITLSNTKTIDMNETLKHQLTKEIWNTSKEVLNHIKQRKG